MGLNLTFTQDENYLKIAKCAKHLNTINSVSLWGVSRSDIPQDLHQFLDGDEGIYSGKNHNKLKISNMTSSQKELLYSLVPKILKLIDDEDVDVGDSNYLKENSSWEDMDYNESKISCCSQCPLAPNENFQRCYPRMGSYSYVASLYDFIGSSKDPAVMELMNNIFAIASSPGGYRIGLDQIIPICEKAGFSQEEIPVNKIEWYQKHLGAIQEIRNVLGNTMMDAAICNNDPDYFYAAKPAQTRYGYSWVAGGGKSTWGVHFEEGIALIDNSISVDFNLPHIYIPTYYKKITRKTEGFDAERFDGTIDHLNSCFLIEFGQPRINTITYGKISSLTQFDHLLDTAEIALKLAIEYDLTIEEC